MADEPNPTRILVGRYRLGPVLGSGAHGTVYLAEDLGRGGEQVALKRVRGEVDSGGWKEPAAEILQWFRHPNWADILDTGVAGECAWFQTTRYVRGRSLDRLEGPQDPELVWRFLEDGARVLQALHRHDLIHYDVTPGNFLLEETEDGPHFVLTDGGLAHEGPVEGFTRGTPLYMAPELTEDRAHDHRVDLYSLGLVAFRLATGQEAFGDDPRTALPKRRRRGAPHANTVCPGLPDSLDELIACLLAPRPEDRPADGRAILDGIARGRGLCVPEFLPAESYAAAGGGCLVGRSDALGRFEESCGQLAELLRSSGGQGHGTIVAGLKDPVLLVTGQASAGGTRTIREMAHCARKREVPVLLLAGRRGAPSPNDPLAHILECLASLEERDISTVDATASRPRPTRRERAYAKHRAIGRFVRRTHAAARHTPFVLAIEDFGELPALAQDAIRVLARDLLARSEHGPTPSAPPFLLLVDLGPTTPEPFQIPDSANPDSQVLPLPPLGINDILSICTTRFPDLEITQEGTETVYRVSEGLPGTLVALLGEAIRRRDLCMVDTHWEWNLEEIEEYETTPHLSPQIAGALRAADVDLTALLGHLALVESDLDASVVTQLWAGLSTSAIPSTPLLITRKSNGQTVTALPSHGLRRTIRAALETEPDRQRSCMERLLTALEDQSEAGTIIDRARLHLILGRAATAVVLVSTHWEDFEPEQRYRTQALLRQAVQQDPTLLETPRHRAVLASLLERGPDAVSVATALADCLGTSGLETRAVLQVAEVLQDAANRKAAANLLQKHTDAPGAGPSDRALLRVRLGMLALDRYRAGDADGAACDARSALKEALAAGEADRGLLAEYLRLQARRSFLDRKSRRAIRLLSAAEHVTRGTRLRTLRAHLFNNHGVALTQEQRNEEARFHFRRSRRLKMALGDVKGTASTSLNLARLHARDGELLEATRLCIECVRHAQRYGLRDTLVHALRQLADVYDRQHRPTLAVDTLLRTWRVVRSTESPETTGRIASDLAPAAAAVGRGDIASDVLLATARLARTTERVDPARGSYHVMASLVALHMGNPRRLRVSLARAERYASELPLEEDWALGYLQPLAFPEEPHPKPGLLEGMRHLSRSSERHLYRVYLWYRRALRAHERGDLPPGLPARRDDGPQGIPAGAHGRVAAEILLAAAQHDPPFIGDGALSQVQSYTGLSGASLLHARTLGVRSAARSQHEIRPRAYYFSQAVAHLDRVVPGNARVLRQTPHEVVRSADRLSSILSARPEPLQGMRDLHALAHKALVRVGSGPDHDTSGSSVVPDERLAAALRRVLEASAKMRSGDRLRDLLASITRHTIDVTGAQRACVVLRDAESGLEIQESACSWDTNETVALRDVSNTVIRRVLETQSPVYKPYVIEDSDLLEESESISKLGLLSILCVPLRRRGEVYGVLYADSMSVGAFEAVDLEVLSLFADQAAAAIETSRLVEHVQHSFEQLKALQDRLVRGERLRVMGELSSGVAHEFNNLLTAILARIQMMSLGYLPPDAQKDLDLIEKAALDAAAVVRRLQGFSRRQRQVDFTDVDLAGVCKDAVDLLRPLWRSRSKGGRTAISVRLRVEPDLHVRGDPTELREVATNLLKNAIEGIEEEGRVAIVARRVRGQIRVSVQDDGCGIPGDVLAKVYDPFFTTKGERGTGLGLSLSLQIVERHGGTIHIESQEGEGTVVTVRLPAAEPVDAPAARPPADPGGAEHPPLRVVVVDDDADVLGSLCAYLERCGCLVTAASNGAVGLEKVLEHEPDVVLTDARMPVMDGLELCRRLHSARPHLPIVLMSGWASDLDRARAREIGARDVLPKPFEMAAVTRLLASVARSTNG